MGINILKLKWHLVAFFRIVFYKLIFGARFKIGKGSTFRRAFSLYIDRNAIVQIGENCFFNHYCSINALENIKIGDGCIFGENVKIYDHNHRFSNSNVSIKEQGFSISPVIIGNHCWFGSNVVVLKGCKIGSNVIVGAGCVISESIPDSSIVSMNRDLKTQVIQNKKEDYNDATG